jgi:AcrR family transcriptional regulator
VKSTRQPRSYSSPARRQQAHATRQRIADAAEELLRLGGYAGMTIADVADKAEVAPQTVYAIFGSKRGIFQELIGRVASKILSSGVVEQVEAATNPAEILRLVAYITRRVHEETSDAFSAVRGAAVLSPDLADLAKETEQIRYEKQARLFTKLKAHCELRSDVEEHILRDMVWSLTGREFYRLLVLERSWPPERYEQWLVDIFTHSLFPPPSLPRP